MKECVLDTNFELKTDRTNEIEGQREKQKRQNKIKKKKREGKRKNEPSHNLVYGRLFAHWSFQGIISLVAAVKRQMEMEDKSEMWDFP